MKVLHLASWYPNRTGEQDGDFIQRHLQAISLIMPVHVIHIVKDDMAKTTGHSRETKSNGQLNETIRYYRPLQTKLSFFNKLVSIIRYVRVFKDEINRYISHNGKPDLVHVHVAMRAGILALWLKRKYKIRFIVSEHWTGYCETDPDNFTKRDFIFKYYTKQILSEADWVISVSAKLMNRLNTLFVIRNSSVIYNVVNSQYFFYKEKDTGVFRFVHASSMHAQKNIEGILSTLSMLNKQRQDWTCTMVGPVKPEYLELCSHLGIRDRVSWKGSVDYDKVALEMQQSSALLMFSRYENLSCVICEALCCGLPVISSDVGGIPEIIDTSNGKLCTSGDEALLLKNISALMDEYSAYNRAAIAEKAFYSFSYHLIGEKFISLYNQLKNDHEDKTERE